MSWACKRKEWYWGAREGGRAVLFCLEIWGL
jgi:hypothetical protein